MTVYDPVVGGFLILGHKIQKPAIKGRLAEEKRNEKDKLLGKLKISCTA